MKHVTVLKHFLAHKVEIHIHNILWAITLIICNYAWFLVPYGVGNHELQDIN